MAIIKISELPPADTPLSASDVVPALQNGVTKKAAINQFGFLQSGTGSTTRTIQSKLRDTVSPKDFGAVGDGVADDSAAIVAAIKAAGSFNKIVDGGGATYKISANCTDKEPTDFLNARYFDPGFEGGVPSLQNIYLTGAAVIVRRQKFVTWKNVTVEGVLRIDGVWFSNFDSIYVQGMQMMGGNGRIDYDNGTSTDGNFWGTYWNFFSNVFCWWQGLGVNYPLIFQRSYGPVNQNTFKSGLCGYVKAYMTNGVINGDVNCQNNVLENIDISGSTTAPDGNSYQVVWDTQYGGSPPNEGRLTLQDCYYDTGMAFYGDVILDGGLNGQGTGLTLKNYGSYQDANIVVSQGGAARINLTGEGQPYEPGFDYKYVWPTATSYMPIWFQETPFGAAPVWATDLTEPFGYGQAAKTNLVNNGAGQNTIFRPQPYIADGAGVTLSMYWRPVNTNGLYVGDPATGSPVAFWRFPYGSNGWELFVAHSPSYGVSFIASAASGPNLEFYVSPAICFTPGLHMQIPAPDRSISFGTPLLVGSGDSLTAYSPWDNVNSRLGNLYGQRKKKSVSITTNTTNLVWTISVNTNSVFEVEVQIANDLNTSNVYGRKGYARVNFVITRGPPWSSAIDVVTGQKVIGPGTGPGNISDITATVSGSTVLINAVVAAFSPNGTDTYDTALIMRSITPRTQTITAT